MPGKDFDVEFFAAAYGNGEARIIIAMKQAQRGGFHGRNQNRHSTGGEFVESGRTLLLHVGVRRKILKREHVVRGQTNDPIWIDGSGQVAAGAERKLQSLSRFVVGNNHDDRLLGGTSEQWNVK